MMRRGNNMKGKDRPLERKTEYCSSCKRKYTRENPQAEKSKRCSKCSAILLRAYLSWESLRLHERMELPQDLHRERAIEILETIASFEAPLPTRMYDFKSLS
jgi:hypothetical protein